MSSPQFTHVLKLLEPYGWTLPATVAHDCGYSDDLELLTAPAPCSGGLASSPEWKPFTLTKDECDQLLKELLDVLAGGDRTRQNLSLVIYETVRLAGQPAFNAARSLRQPASGLNNGGNR